MALKLSKDKQEPELGRTERQEVKAEIAENYATRPRRPRNGRRTITFPVLGVIALLAVVFGFLVLLPSPPQQPTVGVPIGTAVPAFDLPIYGGRGVGSTINLTALRGHPVILNFWSESCPPCRTEVPFLQRTYAQYAAQHQFALLGINQADPKGDIATFGADFNITYPLLFDSGDKINEAYGVTAIPTTYFIDSTGIVRSVFVQPLTSSTLQQGLSSVGIVLHP